MNRVEGRLTWWDGRVVVCEEYFDEASFFDKELTLSASPDRIVSEINLKILAHSPKMPYIKLAILVSFLAVTLFLCSPSVLLASNPLFNNALKLAVGIPYILLQTLFLDEFDEWKRELPKIESEIAKIAHLKDKVFLYSHMAYTDAGLSHKELNEIRQYFIPSIVSKRSIRLPFKVSTTYLLSGGDIDPISPTLLKLQKRSPRSQEKEVILHRRPWIELTLSLHRSAHLSQNQKEHFCRLTGFMVHSQCNDLIYDHGGEQFTFPHAVMFQHFLFENVICKEGQ